MIEIGGKPIMWYTMKAYFHYGFNEFVICAGYKQQIIKEWFLDYCLDNSDVTFDFTDGKDDVIIHNQHCESWPVSVIDTGLNTMTGGRIKRIQPIDDVSDVDISELVGFHRRYGKIATITSAKFEQQKGILAISDDDIIHAFRKKVIWILPESMVVIWCSILRILSIWRMMQLFSKKRP